VNPSLYFDILIIAAFVGLPRVDLPFNLGHGFILSNRVLLRTCVEDYLRHRSLLIRDMAPSAMHVCTLEHREPSMA
jgi:hypothetical protein